MSQTTETSATQTYSYLKHDLTILALLLVVVAGILAGLKYNEVHGGSVITWAQGVLDRTLR